jgi:ParB family chromosome partitioning protein
LVAPTGEVVGKAVFSGTDVKLTIERDRAPAFASFLEGELPALIERFFAREGGE